MKDDNTPAQYNIFDICGYIIQKSSDRGYRSNKYWSHIQKVVRIGPLFYCNKSELATLL